MLGRAIPYKLSHGLKPPLPYLASITVARRLLDPRPSEAYPWDDKC
jgi:hypothetical protein